MRRMLKVNYFFTIQAKQEPRQQRQRLGAEEGFHAAARPVISTNSALTA